MSPVAGVLFGTVGPLFLKTIPQGAATEVFVAASPKVEGVSGEYFADCNVETPRAEASDPELAKKLWAKSEEIVASL